MESPKSEINSDFSQPQLNLPPADLRIKLENNLLKVFDLLRKKFVALTPEEYVRQHFVNFLMNYKGYPASIMANEIGINLNGTSKRCDTVVFSPDGLPMVIVEYKSPEVKITQDVVDPIARYNLKLQAQYLIVSYGMNHYCYKINYNRYSYKLIPQISVFKSIACPL